MAKSQINCIIIEFQTNLAMKCFSTIKQIRKKDRKNNNKKFKYMNDKKQGLTEFYISNSTTGTAGNL